MHLNSSVLSAIREADTPARIIRADHYLALEHAKHNVREALSVSLSGILRGGRGLVFTGPFEILRKAELQVANDAMTGDRTLLMEEKYRTQ